MIAWVGVGMWLLSDGVLAELFKMVDVASIKKNRVYCVHLLT
jgi:hypothetical protein